jgi:hypothetical protein
MSGKLTKTFLNTLEERDLPFEPMLDFDVEELRNKADMLAQEGDHPAADIADMLQELNFDGDVLNDEERDVVFGGLEEGAGLQGNDNVDPHAVHGVGQDHSA